MPFLGEIEINSKTSGIKLFGAKRSGCPLKECLEKFFHLLLNPYNGKRPGN